VRSSPEAFWDRFRPSADRAVLGWNFAGQSSHQDALTLARRGILEEVGARVANWRTPLGDENVPLGLVGLFREHRKELDGLGRFFNGADDEALAWAYGQALRDRARPVKSEPNRESVQAAVRFFQTSPEAQEALGAYAGRKAHLWDSHIQPEEHMLRSAELFSQRGYNLIGELNQALKANGGDWGAAFKEVIQGPWGRQYAAFFTGNQRDVTETTLMLEYVPRRLNEGLGSVGIPGTHSSLGLPDRDLLSGGSILGNLFLKRVLPVGVGYELYRYLDYKGEELGTGGPSDLYANVRSHLADARAHLVGKRILGVRRELLPGLEKWLPERDPEEEKEFREGGYEPVRKGRFWLMGSRSQFQGDKVSYFLPAADKVARSHWQGAENVDTNTADYWSHSLLPLPENLFLGPLSHFLDLSWWERKHASGPNAERPYPVSSPLVDPNTLHGPFINAILGPLLKPQEVYYPEYVPRSAGGTATREDLRRINEGLKRGADRDGIQALVGGAGTGGGYTGEYGYTGLGSPGVVGPRGRGPIAAIGQVSPGGEIGIENLPSGGGGRSAGHGGGSGGPTPVGWGTGPGHTQRLTRRELTQINEQLKAGMGGGTPRSAATVARLSAQKGVWADEDLDLINPQSGTVAGANALLDAAGLYGYLIEQVAPAEQHGLVLPNAQEALGYNRRFYELELGGLGGELSEIGRRFLPRKKRVEGNWNPVPNHSASWLPDGSYFLDFHHGDPFAAVPRGELRLPGAAYERLHPDLKVMQSRASSLGRSVEEIMQGMLFLQEPLDRFGQEVTQTGDAIHLILQRRWKRMGVLLGAEDRIYDAQEGISGHYDAILRTVAGPALTDIKTVSAKRYAQAQKEGAFEEHATQVTWYMHETGLRNAFITYVNRDALKTGRVESFLAPVTYDEHRLQRALSKVQDARQRLQSLVQRGTIDRGDLYDPITRFEVLSDVAPYSENYAQLREYLTEQHKGGELSEAENTRFQAAKKRAMLQKHRVETYPYRFAHAAVEQQVFTVENILDPNTIQVKESDHPLRLAGLRASAVRVEEEWGQTPAGMTPAEWMFRHYGITRGSRITALTDADSQHQVTDDTLQTMHAVLMRDGRNVNYDLIQRGVGTEKETDWSATGVHARFTPGELKAGAIWEGLAHLNTPYNNKLLRVRSPLEELERGIVYGKNTGTWSHPFRDYLWPSIESFAARDMLAGGIGLGMFLQFFARTREAKVATVIGGAALGGALSLLREVDELSGSVWKPARTQKREDLEEYWDVLKYVKFRGLTSQEDRAARATEGVNVERLTRELHARGQTRKRRRNWLERQKRALLLHGGRDEHGEELAGIQDELDHLSETPGSLRLGPHATKALLYRQLFQSTLYGIDPGETPFKNVFSAFPKYKRELIQGWIDHSDPHERRRIFQLLPDAERRVLGRQLGIDPKQLPERAKLRDFFKRHPLPGADWAGWQPDVDLEALRMRAIRAEGLDPMESGIFDLQVDEAEQVTGVVPVPTLRGGSRDIQQTLNQLLSGRGLKNVRVLVDARPHGGDRDRVEIHMDVQHRREEELRRALQLHG
jgi:hypothetical protein